MAEKMIEFENVTKKYGSFIANKDINLQLYRGEVLALLGENGAGKSTMMGMLSGIHQPSSGLIKVHGQEVKINNPRISKDLGIGMVYQHFMQISVFTVLENIILGDELTSHGKIDYKKSRQQIQKIIDKYELDIDLDAKVSMITVGMQQRVEIIKALYRQANIIIFDEPTAALTPQEIDELLIIFRKLCDEGKSIIFITHKLREIKQIADRCAIIRSGEIIDTVTVENISETKLAEMMIGRKIKAKNIKQRQLSKANEVLRVENLIISSVGKTEDKVNFNVKSGEIVGIAGVDGNGQNELVEYISGLKKIKHGTIKVKNKIINSMRIRKINELGVGFIPEDRQKTGLILPFSVAKNLTLKKFYQSQFSKFGWLNKRAIAQYSQQLIREFSIKTRSENTSIEELSGGNQQKVIIAREIANKPQLLIAVNPTRGVDIGAGEYIHERLIQQRNHGSGVLLISFELDEILKLSDRILVMSDGKVVGEVLPEDTTNEELGLLMAGEINA